MASVPGRWQQRLDCHGGHLQDVVLKTWGLFVNPRHWLTWPCSVVFIAAYNKCDIPLLKWVTLNAAPCTYSLFVTANRATCFGWYLHPSSGADVTVSTAYGISKTVNATYREARLVTITIGYSYSFTSTRCCGYSDMSCWWCVEIPSETCRAVYRYKQNVYSCSLMDNYWHIQGCYKRNRHFHFNITLKVSISLIVTLYFTVHGHLNVKKKERLIQFISKIQNTVRHKNFY